MPTIQILVLGTLAAMVSGETVDVGDVLLQVHSARNSVQVNAATKPNVVLLLVDDTGYNDLGFHQNKASPPNPDGLQTTAFGETATSPNIDRLLTESVKLNNYYVQCVCSPTRSALMTGRYPFHTGMGPGVTKPGMAMGLASDETVLAETMRDAGYSTHMIGKWHLGDSDERYTPTFRGFDSYLGYMLGKNEYFLHTCAGAIDFRKSKLNSANVMPENTDEYKNVYSTYVYAERVQEIVDNKDERPIFIYFSPNSLHSMFTGAPQSHLDKFTGPNFEGTDGIRRQMQFGMVSALDEMVGALEETFKNAGIWDNTVLIFTTDNGGNQNGGFTKDGVWAGGSSFPLRGNKKQDYEGGVRGIGFVRGAKDSAPLEPGTSDAMIHVSDWYPTIVGLAGGTHQGSLPLDGVDQWATLSAGANSGPRTSIPHNVPYRADGESLADAAVKYGYSAAYRKGELKLLYVNPNHGYVDPKRIQDTQAGFEIDSPLVCEPPDDVDGKLLFNVVADPRECTNLAGDAEYAGQLAEMIADLDALSQEALPDMGLVYGKDKALWKDGKSKMRKMNEKLGMLEWTEWDCKAEYPDKECGWPLR
jgi:arylsulfatase B/arylsulfatase I/J